MNSINSSNSKLSCSIICSNKKSCQALADTDTRNRYEQRLESIYVITKRSRASKKTQEFLSKVVKSGCFRTNESQIHCTKCHKIVSSKECIKYIDDQTVDKFHEASCDFFQQHAENTEVIKKSNELAQSNPITNNHTICSVLSKENHTCQELATMEHIRIKLMFIGQGAVLSKKGLNKCALNLVREGCFRTSEEDVHCTKCHKSVHFELAKQYCLENLGNKFHESSCDFFKTNSDNTAATSNSNRLAINYPQRHSHGIYDEAISNSHTNTTIQNQNQWTLPNQPSNFVIDNIVLSDEDMINSNYRSFSFLDDRIKSFTEQSWPHAIYQTAKSMARTGFFYSYYGDLVVCFYCGTGIMQWTVFDDPELEHAKWSYNCAYLKQLKGVKFINDTQLKYREFIADHTNARRHTTACLPMTRKKALIVGVTSESRYSSSMFYVTSPLA